MKYRILVVEDGAGHLADAKRVLSLITDKFLEKKIPIEIEPVYATNLLDALKLLESADAVISDVFFPRKEGEAEEACGVEIMKKSLSLKKGIVLITSTYHHGEKTQPVLKESCMYGLEMFDCRPKDLMRGEADHKPWGTAITSLVGMKIALERGTLKFAEKDKSGDYGVYLRKDGLDAGNNSVGGESDKAFFSKMKESNWSAEECDKWIGSLLV